MVKIFLRKKLSKRIAEGHPWVFENEIGDENGYYKPGDIVSVFSSNGSFVGKGYINPYSKIKIRILTRNSKKEINKEFFFERILKAWQLRQRLGFEQYGRIVFSESDFLPGLIVDKFNDYLVFQTLTLGMDYWKKEIIEILESIFETRNIYEKNNMTVRTLEGLEMKKGFVFKDMTATIPFEFVGLKFEIDIENHLRTGLYWEQLLIAKEVIPFSENAEVLDVFCHSGITSLTAAKHGASSVIGIDNDEQFLRQSEYHASVNDLSNICSFLNQNAFDYLKKQSMSPNRFDLIILDTPSLAFNKSQLLKAKNGYKELHLRAMKLLKSGGILISVFSSYLFTEEMIFEIFEDSAKDTFKTIRILKNIRQAADHPILSNMPSSQYFKAYIVEIN